MAAASGGWGLVESPSLGKGVRREPACRLPPPPLTSAGRLRWASPELSVGGLCSSRTIGEAAAVGHVSAVPVVAVLEVRAVAT